MRSNWKSILLAAFAAVLLSVGLVACGPDEDEVEETPTVTEEPVATTGGVEVTSVDLGTEIGADNRVTTPTTTFAPDDTIYVAVTTDGAAAGETLAARWLYEDGQVVDQTERTLSGSGGVYEFHVSKPDGWPAGTYTVEITLDGQQVESRTFTVG